MSFGTDDDMFKSKLPLPFILAYLSLIGAIVVASAVAFGYTAGWLSPDRLTPEKIVDALRPPTGEARGHRRNHAKGICFTGHFEANGSGTALSKATVFAKGTYPVLGRFNLGVADPNAADGSARVRGIGIRITTPDGVEWRSGMINAPVFPVSTPEAFYELLKASASKDPDAMKTFAAAHPEIAAFAAWQKSAPWTGSYAEERYNSINAFLFTNGGGASRAVRWSLVPIAQPVPLSQDDLNKRGPDFLKKEIADRVMGSPQQWTMVVTGAGPDDPTNDPSKAWPDERPKLKVGQLTVDKVIAEPDGPCRDINFDPTVLPPGMATSDDPYPAARSSAYANSYDRRTAEEGDYPRTANGAHAQ
jgi:catalase